MAWKRSEPLMSSCMNHANKASYFNALAHGDVP